MPATLVGGSVFTVPVLSTGGIQQFYMNWTSTATSVWQAYYNGTAQTAFTTHNIQAPANAGTYNITFNSPQVAPVSTYSVIITAPSSPIISLDPYSGSASVSSPITVTGEYGGGTPTALDYQWDATGWQTNGTATLYAGGTFSLVIPAPTSLTTGVKHNLYVAFHSYPSSSSLDWDYSGVTMTP